MDKDRKYVLITPGHGRYHLSENLKSLGYDRLKAVSVNDALDQLNRLGNQLAALAIPSLANVDGYDDPKKVVSLIDRAVWSRVPRVGVISMMASAYLGWQYKSNTDTIVRVVRGDDSNSFFMAYANFLAGLRDDL